MRKESLISPKTLSNIQNVHKNLHAPGDMLKLAIFMQSFSSTNTQNLPSWEEIKDESVLHIALYIYYHLISETNIEESHILHLIQFEQKDGGPYRNNQEKKDIDFGANILLFIIFSFLGVTLEGSYTYLENSIKKNEIQSDIFNKGEINTLIILYQYICEDAIISEKRASVFEEITDLLDDTGLDMLNFNQAAAEYVENNADIDLNQALLLSLAISCVKKNLETKQYDNFIAQEIIDDITAYIESDIRSNIAFADVLLKTFPFSKDFKSIRIPLNTLQSKEGEGYIEENIKILKPFITALHYSWLAIHVIDEVIDGDLDSGFAPYALSLMGQFQNYVRSLKLEPEQLKLFEKSMSRFNNQYLYEVHVMQFSNKQEAARNIKFFNADYEYAWHRVAPFLFGLSLMPTILDIDTISGEAIYESFKIIMVIDQINDDGHDWMGDLEEGIMTYPVYKFLNEKFSGSTKDTDEIFLDVVLPNLVEVSKQWYKKVFQYERMLDIDYVHWLLERSIRPLIQAEQEIESAKKTLELIED